MVTDRREAVAGLLLRLRAMDLPGRLMAAFEAVPRQNFVPVMHLDASYGTGQLPIECGQVMGSADQIAQMLRQLDLESGQRVLEIGTGTGYQAAVIGQIAAKVTTLERWRTLAEKARQRLGMLSAGNVTVELADGREGVSGQIYDRIIINGACSDVPRHFLDQLAAGGQALVPVGPPEGPQTVKKLVKIGARFEAHDLHEVRFQPLLAGISQAI